jgi:hypothetical protein
LAAAPEQRRISDTVPFSPIKLQVLFLSAEAVVYKKIPTLAAFTVPRHVYYV